MSRLARRICISLYFGVAAPSIYFLLLMALDAGFGARLQQASRWLQLPISWPAEVFKSLSNPPITSAADVLKAATDQVLFSFVANIVFYAAACFLLLSVGDFWKRDHAIMVDGSQP